MNDIFTLGDYNFAIVQAIPYSHLYVITLRGDIVGECSVVNGIVEWIDTYDDTLACLMILNHKVRGDYTRYTSDPYFYLSKIEVLIG